MRACGVDVNSILVSLGSGFTLRSGSQTMLPGYAATVASLLRVIVVPVGTTNSTSALEMPLLSSSSSVTTWENTNRVAVLAADWYCAWRVSEPMDSGNVGMPDTETSSLNVTASVIVSPVKYKPLLGGDTASTPVTYGASGGATCSTNDRPYMR